jgi:uncharacterized LabA/DUF88 family protein
MTVSSANRTALFIDGVNLYSSAKALGFDIDYKRLLKEFQSHGTLVRAFYYTAVTEDQEFSSVRPLLDWLDYNGFTVVTKPTKEFTNSSGHRKWSRATWTSSLQSMRWSLLTASIKSCFSPAAEIFARWSKLCSDAAFASRWSPRFPASLQCLPTNFAAKRTYSPI